MKYKIGIDLTYIIDNRVSGIKKYAEEIIFGLTKFDDYQVILFVDSNFKKYFEEEFPECKIVSINFLFRNIRFIRRINKFNFIKNSRKKIIENEKCDIMIYPYINDYSLLLENRKKIISILDVIPLDEIKDKESEEYKKVEKENIDIMNMTPYIVTISEYSKRRLLEINPGFKGQIKVIPSPVEKPRETSKKVTEILNFDTPYILSINSFYKYKNQITLVKAFNKIKDKLSINLVLVGRPELDSNNSGYTEVIDYIEKNNLKNRVNILSYISDEDRNCLLYNANLFVTTSMQEGFGRTPVEAAMCRVPVISSNEKALPEATLNEVYYYNNVMDDEELSNKIMEVLENRPLPDKLEDIARKLEKEYNEERIAKKYIELITKISEGDTNAKN